VTIRKLLVGRIEFSIDARFLTALGLSFLKKEFLILCFVFPGHPRMVSKNDNVDLISKPYDLDLLAARIRSILDR
jgi:hypothetical protein